MKTYGQALHVIIRGPASINILKNAARSRMNRFGIYSKIPPAIIAFSATVVKYLNLLLFSSLTSPQIYFLLIGEGNFEIDPEGTQGYRKFFNDRFDEIVDLGPKSRTQLFEFLEEEVFGTKQKESTAEERRQREFSTAQRQAIRAQAAKEEEEENVGIQHGNGQ